MWRYYPLSTDNTQFALSADVTHRQHTIIEPVHPDLIVSCLSGMSSGRFAADSAWAICHDPVHGGHLPAHWPWAQARTDMRSAIFPDLTAASTTA